MTMEMYKKIIIIIIEIKRKWEIAAAVKASTAAAAGTTKMKIAKVTTVKQTELN